MKLTANLVFAVLALVGTMWAQAPAADPVILTIGTEKITKSQFENIIATLNDQQKAMLEANPEAKRSLAEQIAELKVMAQEARARGLDKSTVFQTKMALRADQDLAGAIYQEMTKNPPSDADMQAFYKEHANEFTQAKGRHILVRFQGSRVPVREGQKDLTDDEALARVKELRTKIVGGAKFADVAKTDSDDVGSGENGGELGAFGPGEMVDAFDAVAFTIPVGTVSEPVKSDFGYHLILIEERGAKPFEEVKAQIDEAIRPELGQKAVDALKAKTPVTYDDGYFGPAAPAAPQPAN